MWLQLQWLVMVVQTFTPYLTWEAPDFDGDWDFMDQETGKPLIALSIDDVPCTYEKFGPSDIESTINLLEEHGAKATLFLMSRELSKHDAEKGVSSVLSKAISKGFEIGNHDLLDVKTIRKSSPDFIAALRECDEQIDKLVENAGQQWHGWREFVYGRKQSSGKNKGANTEGHESNTSAAISSMLANQEKQQGADVDSVETFNSCYRDPLTLALQEKTIKWFRPGGGLFSHNMVKIAAEHGYSTVLGNCFPFDTHMPAKHNAEYVRRRAKPGKIIVIHDRPKLLSTLRIVLPDLCKRFKVVTLSELFQAAAKAKVQSKGKHL